MDGFAERIAKLPPKKLALLASELYARSLRPGNVAAEPIAITAMACRLPGGANTPEAFWSLLEGAGDAVERIPDARLALSGTDRSEIAGIGSDWGAFIGDVEKFDPAVFGISANEAEAMDPQQRLLLEVCWEALENTGTPIGDLQESQTGVFIGASGMDYALLNHGASGSSDGYAVTGVANAIAAGRVSYVFGFSGPATVVDTACSASASASRAWAGCPG